MADLGLGVEVALACGAVAELAHSPGQAAQAGVVGDASDGAGHLAGASRRAGWDEAAALEDHPVAVAREGEKDELA